MAAKRQQRRLAKHNAQLAGEADERRHAAQQALETFKAQLTLDAEVRRHVAAKKVELLVKTVAATNVVTGVFLEIGEEFNNKIRLEALHAWWLPARELVALVGKEMRQKVEAFSGEFTQVNSLLYNEIPGAKPDLLAGHKLALEARDRLFKAVQEELQIATDSPAGEPAAQGGG